MIRTSSSERACRINNALVLINKCKSLSKAAEVLAKRYGISKRQAYRYVHEAGIVGEKVPIPEQKIVFTVKLSKSLVHKLRQRAKSTRQTLSDMVAQALKAFLHKGRGSG